jgi:hypothetical protein
MINSSNEEFAKDLLSVLIELFKVRTNLTFILKFVFIGIQLN